MGDWRQEEGKRGAPLKDQTAVVSSWSAKREKKIRVAEDKRRNCEDRVRDQRAAEDIWLE